MFGLEIAYSIWSGEIIIFHLYKNHRAILRQQIKSISFFSLILTLLSQTNNKESRINSFEHTREYICDNRQ